MSSLQCTYAWALIHLHDTGSQEGIPVAVPEEPEEQPEIPEQEVPEADEEVGEDLLECPDHRPSSFERGKPQSIISLLLYKAFYYIYVVTEPTKL
jgi:hypothetical protein